MNNFADDDDLAQFCPVNSRIQKPMIPGLLQGDHRDMSHYPSNTFAWDVPIREPFELRHFVKLWMDEDPYLRNIMRRSHETNAHHQGFSAWLNDYIHTEC